MRVLITGIGGFAGSHLADLLVEEGVEVWGVVRGDDANVAHLKERIELLHGDLREPAIAQVVLAQAQPDFVFHLAGQSHVAQSWQDPWGTMEANLRTQVNLLRAAADMLLDARILVFGSMEEYGRVAPAALPINEDAPLRPDSPYGVSKIAQDMLGLQYHLSRSLDVVRVRPFNHIGPRQKPIFVASDFAKQIAEIEAGRREPMIHVGNLSAQRDFTDVRDTVRAYWQLAQDGAAGDVYNVGSGVPHSVQELLNILLSHSGAPIRVEQDQARLRPSDLPIAYCDNRKLRAATGWEPRISFEQSLREVLEYWRGQLG